MESFLILVLVILAIMLIILILILCFVCEMFNYILDRDKKAENKILQQKGISRSGRYVTNTKEVKR